MIQLVYQSTAAEKLASGDIFKIVERSASNNSAAGLTGFLLFSNGQFFQLIEGPEDAIEGLMRKLEKDERHHSIKVVFRTRIANRSFPRWRMKRFAVTQCMRTLTQIAPEIADASEPVKQAIEEWIRHSRC